MPRKYTKIELLSDEIFFGTLKAECLNRRKFTSRRELQEVVAQYVQFYNGERIQ